MSATGLKQVGFIDLSSLNMKTRPERKSRSKVVYENSVQERIDGTLSEENTLQSRLDEMRGRFDKSEKEAVGREVEELRNRLCGIRRREELRVLYSLKDGARDSRLAGLLDGIEPSPMSAVHYSCGNHEGIALAYDANHYVFATDMYDDCEDENGLSRAMDRNSDGTFGGIYPAGTVLSAASSLEIRIVEHLREVCGIPMSEIDAYMADAQKSEQEAIAGYEERLKELEVRLAALTMQEMEIADLKRRISGVQHKRCDIRRGAENNLSQLPKSEMTERTDDVSYPHLPYLRGERSLLTFDYPCIDDGLTPWLHFRLRANITRIIDHLRKHNSLTHILLPDYFAEISERARNCYRGRKMQDIIVDGDVASGVLVFPNGDGEDTLIYEMSRLTSNTVTLIYLRGEKLLLYENYSESLVVGQPRIDSYICHSLRTSGMDANKLFQWLRNMVISFLCMENDMYLTAERIVEEGNACRDVAVPDTCEVIRRDGVLYTDMTVLRKVPDEGFVTYRWQGSGQQRVMNRIGIHPKG